jgi:hypothetical protein
VVGGVEQELALGDDAFQDTDGVHDRGDRDPGNCALLTSGDVVAVGVADVLVVVGPDQMARHGAVGIRLRVRTAAGSQRPSLLGAHPGQIQDHDCGGRGQVPHQDRCLLVVHALAPGAPLDPARHRHLHRAGAGPPGGDLPEPVPRSEMVDLVPAGPRDRGDVVVSQGDAVLSAHRGGQEIPGVDQLLQTFFDGGQALPGARGGLCAGVHAAALGPGGQDVVGEVLDQADRPGQQGTDHGRVQRLGLVLPACLSRVGWQVSVDTRVLPGRTRNAAGADGQLVESPQDREPAQNRLGMIARTAAGALGGVRLPMLHGAVAELGHALPVEPARELQPLQDVVAHAELGHRRLLVREGVVRPAPAPCGEVLGRKDLSCGDSLAR